MKVLLLGLVTCWVMGVTIAAPSSLTPEEENSLVELLEAAETVERNRRFDKSWKLSKLTSVSSLSHYPDHDHHVDDYVGHLDYDHKAFDAWAFKKAILASLFQAIKAITGGVIALKGHLLKAKGHFTVTKGEILKTKGEAITEFGRHLATKALLTPVVPPPLHTHHHHHHAPEVVHSSEEAAPVVHSHIHMHDFPGKGHDGGAYLPPPDFHHPPPPHHHDVYGPPHKRDAPPESGQLQKLPEGVQAGLIILKPVEIPTEGFSIEQQNVYKVPSEFHESFRRNDFYFK